MTDDPLELATIVASSEKPLLIGSDVDGTLAELTESPRDASLVAGALDALLSLRDRGCVVAIVSGRSMRDLVDQFELPATLQLIGSHGAERAGDEESSRPTAEESATLRDVRAMLEPIAVEHEGAWIESKPFGAALHARRCAPDVGERALLAARAAVAELADVRVLEGLLVVEVAVRNISKRRAFEDLRTSLQTATSVFLGDDMNDEAVFESLGPLDVAIKLGAGVTLAGHRLATPHDAVEFLTALAALL